jgi:hypothetical protein
MIVMSGLNNDSTAANWAFSVAATSTTVYSGNGCSPCRWGDYSTVTVDPLNSGDAWAFNQLVTGSSQFSWTTRAEKFSLNLPFGPTASGE